VSPVVRVVCSSNQSSIALSRGKEFTSDTSRLVETSGCSSLVDIGRRRERKSVASQITAGNAKSYSSCSHFDLLVCANISIYRFFFRTRYLDTLPFCLFSFLALDFSAGVSSLEVTGVSFDTLFVGRKVLSPLE